ncbi:MAG: CDP-diacylglycerol--glycerol-3-phosphate 3-phosphatidyltransferase [Gammaproteobacteria bacterium]|nr:MAG: CDP-diacylglycerol--glycerol-3-phosphate 3-phosphatidyltransferase [Gammaproteobacteria bacterium]
MTLPNALTLLRILLVPVLFVIFWWPEPWARPLCALLFLAAAVTDWFDGYLARALDQQSAFGAFLDPVADKLAVATALVLLVAAHPGPWLAFAAGVIIGREITVSALREWMAELGRRAAVKVSWVGKVKTAFQMTAIVLMLWRNPIAGLDVFGLGEILLFAAVALTILSMALYLYAAWPHLTAGRGGRSTS